MPITTSVSDVIADKESAAPDVIADEESAARLVLNTLSSIPKAIKTKEEYELYMAELATAKLKIGKVEEFFMELRRPMNQAVKQNIEKQNKMLEPLQDRYKAIKKMCEGWFMADLQETRRKQDEVNRKHDVKVDLAIAKGKDPASIAPPKHVESRAPASVAVAGGVSISMRMEKHFQFTGKPEITSRYLIDNKVDIYRTEEAAKDLPDEVWILDRSRLLGLLKNGAQIKGVQIIELPSNTVRGA